MNKYVFYTPNKQKKKVEYDFCFASKCIRGKITEKYTGKTNLKQAIEYTAKEKGVLVIALLQHLGSSPKEIIKVCREIGYNNIICCDVIHLNENSVIELCYNKQQRNIYSAICSSIGRRGKGSPGNFTDAGRKKGAKTNKEKAKNNPANRKAIPEIIRLRKLGMTGLKIADYLNNQGLRTSTSKFWTASGVLRLEKRVE